MNNKITLKLQFYPCKCKDLKAYASFNYKEKYSFKFKK